MTAEIKKSTAKQSPPGLTWPAAVSLLTTVLVWGVGVVVAQTENAIPRKWDRSVYAELAKAPKKATERRNPMEGDPEAVAGGAKLYDLHCAGCHGELATGGKKGPSLRADEVQQATPGTIFWLLTNGVVRRGMPVWSKLPEPQRWQLVSYIKSLTPAARPATGDNPSARRTRRLRIPLGTKSNDHEFSHAYRIPHQRMVEPGGPCASRGSFHLRPSASPQHLIPVLR
jgi:mono/diheme cytochrome c family protein